MTELSKSDEWWTTDQLFRELTVGVTIPMLDVAASHKNHKCPFYFTKENSALDNSWAFYLYNRKTKMRELVDIWNNPPLGKGMTKKFVLKAYNEWKLHKMRIINLLPAGVISRSYFQPIWQDFVDGNKNVHIRPIIPRPKFLYEGKETKWSARNDYIVLYLSKPYI